MRIKNLKILVSIVIFVLLTTANTKAADECFEKLVEQFLNLIWC